ncbi:hypothetical protein DL762_007884 [Monosporascus cannonballus]|uniref:Uncharacterized protein n=1 Tax=Monosporascus cannonballus TaxID=155416 RepID=A0ABY0H107_9PEZI|nr:hypothetical protein DL762_007884 [Monosporascus cannonballus]
MSKLESMVSKPKSKKRSRDEDGGARKRRRKSAFEEDGLLFDMEAGVNRAIALMDSQLMSDHIAQKTSRFGTDLSPVELSDLYISPNSILDTTSYRETRILENLPQFLEAFSDHPERLREAPKKNGSPHTIIVTGAGLRAADLVRSVRKYQKKGNAIAKLFAKHIKIEESVQFLQSHRTGMAVGTPKRLNDLVENVTPRSSSTAELVAMKHTGIPLVQFLLANILPSSLAADASPPNCAAHRMIDSTTVTQCIDITRLCQERRYPKPPFQRLNSQCDSHQYGPGLGHIISTCPGTGAEIYMVPPSDVKDELLRTREDYYLAGRQLPQIPGFLDLRQERAAPVPSPALDTASTVPATLLTVATPAMPPTSCIMTAPLPPLLPIPPLTAGMPLPQPIATATATVINTITAPATLQGPYQYLLSPSYHNNGSDDVDAGAGPRAGTDVTSPARPWVSLVGKARNLRPSSYAGLVFWIAIVVAQDIWLHGR